MVPRTVLTRSGPISLNTARPINNVQPRTSVNNAGPMKNVINNAYSTARSPFNKIIAANNSNFTKKVNIVKGTRVNTARPKAVLSAVKENKGNAVNASAYFEEIAGGFVTFRGNSKGEKITGKGKISTGKLDFEDVYFVKKLKFNLFSVSQMCDKKNSVLFTDTECVVLSPDFKLTDESHVLLKVPRKDNMYSVDLKNVVPQGGLTCLFTKATPDESNLWHRRLGHVNFKTINKLVKGNLVRGLPSKLFEINQTCVACQKGKQHRASCIKGEFSVARTPQQNRVAKKKNRTLIEAVKTMLADLKLPTTFWAEAVNTACYVQNMVLVIKPHNKTPYELFLGIKPTLSFMRPFGCPVTILNTIDHLRKFNGNADEADEGFFVGYSTNSKAFRVFNSRTKIVEKNLHVQFNENTPNIVGSGLNWLFDIDVLTKSMNYKPIITGNQSNGSAGTKACDNVGKSRVKTVPSEDYILLPLWTQDPPFSSSLKDSHDVGFKPSGDEEKKDAKDLGNEDGEVPKDNVVDENIVYGCADDLNMPELEDNVHSDDDKDVSAQVDMNNLDTFIHVSPIPTTRIHKDHPVEQIIGDMNSTPQTRRMKKNLEEHGLFSYVLQRTNHKDFQNCLFACFLSQEEPKKLPNGKRAIGTKWVFRNKKDERGIVIKNKARLVAQGYTQKEGIYYDEVFAPIDRIEAIRLFLTYASFKDFVVYQMDVKSAFIYGKIEEEVYVYQPSGFEDTDFPDRVYKVENALYGLHQAPRAWYEILSTYMLDNGFQRGKIDKTLFIRRDKGDILLVQVYVDNIIFDSTKTEAQERWDFYKPRQVCDELRLKNLLSDAKNSKHTNGKPICLLSKDADGEDVDEHLYRSMIGSLMYLTSSRPDIMFAVDFMAMPKEADCSIHNEAEYIAASNCCGQVLWIQNQLLDYGYNFMQTKIHIDNKSIVCIVNNPVFHSKTKHIEIRHHFIRDSNEKKLIQMIKIQTDQNLADLLTKAFDRIIHKGCLGWNGKAAKDEIQVSVIGLTYYCYWNGIRVNAGNSKSMLLGINLLLLV
ncbi:putative ribonuclease H-like domain-containing protein [Tanacetum coccineum]